MERKNTYFIYRFKKLALLFSGVILSLHVAAQTEFKPGFIVTLEKDTLRGFISENTDVDLGLKMEFKKELRGGEVKTYTPKDLLGFGFNYGRDFERMLLVNAAVNAGDSSYVFSKNILRGKVTLLVWRKEKNDSPDLFLVNNQSHETVHLSKLPKKEITGADGHTYMRDDVRYIGLLNYIKGDSSTIKTNSKNYINYSEKVITKNLLTYNEKFKTSYPVSKHKESFERTYDATIVSFVPSKHYIPRPVLRLSIYQNTTFFEKSKNFCFIKGITFFYLNGTSGNATYSFTGLNIIPWGIKFQWNSRNITPYAYAGIGIGFYRAPYFTEVNNETVFQKYGIFPYPSATAGAGLKIRIRSRFIITELTPFLRTGAALNLGFSF